MENWRKKDFKRKMIYKMVFGFGKMYARLYAIKRNKKRQEKEREATKIWSTQERREYLIRNGYSQESIDQLRERTVNVVKTLKEKDEEVQKQAQYNKIRKGKYNERYKRVKLRYQLNI